MSIKNTIDTQTVTVSTGEKEKINILIDLLQDKSSTAAMGGTVYDQAKAEIL